MTERELALDVVRTLRDAGHQALWAGGCVRDQLLGQTPHDYDVATDARPERVRQLFRRTVAVGLSFGVVEVLGPRPLKVQVATFRSDGAYLDGRRPESVTFGTAEADALRRDFTINGMFFDPLTDEVIDYVGGRADLEAKHLRAIGVPEERFSEDKLRLLRAVRFAARFELELEARTRAAVCAMARELPVVSAERIADELRKLLSDRHRARGVRLLREVGLDGVIVPEVPNWDAAEALLGRLPPEATFTVAFAALLRGLSDEIVQAVARRQKLSNAERERIAWLVALFERAPSMERPSAHYPLLIHPGIDEALSLLDAAGTAPVFVTRSRQLLQTKTLAELNPPPLLTGNDLIARGVKPGPAFKTILDELRRAQLDGEIATAEDAVALANRLTTSAVEEDLAHGEKEHRQ